MNKKMSFLMPIRIALVVLLILFIIFLTSDGKESDASMDDVKKNVLAQVDFSSMEESTNRMFKKFYGLNAQDYEAVVLYAPITNMDAEELLIVKLMSTDQAETVTGAIEERLQTQKNSFEGYGIEQYDLLKNHVLDVEGNFILYVVHHNAEQAAEAFRKSL